MDKAEICLREQLSSKYEIIQKLGEGSQGTVYLAQDRNRGKKVAIKQLMIQSIKDWKLYELFHREADTLKRLDVPGVAKLYEAREILDIETPMAVIVQDYIEGEPLQKFISNGHRFRIEQIGEILYQLLGILENLHTANPPVIHRDLKPSNIILNYTDDSATPEVHLIDFGAVSNPQVKGGGSTVVGTYGYMAPEQLMGNATAASDLYSLAIIAVYLMSGVEPEKLEIEDFHVLIDPHLEHLPHTITLFLHQMLEPRAEERLTNYQTIRKFFDALRTQHFERIPNVNTSSSLAKNNYDLANVISYRQAGNIEIWHALSDITPRSIPAKFRKRIRNLVLHHNAFKALCYMSSFLIFFIIIFIMLYFVGGFAMAAKDQFTVLAIGSVLLLILITIIAANYAEFKRLFSSVRNLKKFMKRARKSMATLIRVEYIPIYPTLDKSDDIYTSYQPDIYTSYQPTWRLTYSFNPPDDSSPDPLIHTTKTHTLPNNIKEGDLIPILYDIEIKDGTECVSSIPYPFPTADDVALFVSVNEDYQKNGDFNGAIDEEITRESYNNELKKLNNEMSASEN